MHYDISYSNGHTHPRVAPSNITRDELMQIELDIATTPHEFMRETLHLCAPRIEDMIEHGVIDRGEASDALWRGCVGSGLVAERGADFVQQMLAEACTEAGREKAAKLLQDDQPDMSIVQRNQTPAPPFPLEILGEAADWVKQTAESKSAPVDYGLLP